MYKKISAILFLLCITTQAGACMPHPPSELELEGVRQFYNHTPSDEEVTIGQHLLKLALTIGEKFDKQFDFCEEFEENMLTH